MIKGAGCSWTNQQRAKCPFSTNQIDGHFWSFAGWVDRADVGKEEPALQNPFDNNSIALAELNLLI